MHKLLNDDDESNFDGRELARRFYDDPTEAKAAGDGSRSTSELPPEYDDLFGPPALCCDPQSETPPPREKLKGRVPFDPHLPFYELRRRCIAAGKRFGKPYERLLSRLRNIEPLPRHEAEESRGALYRRLCAAAHLAGFSKRERKNLYWIAEKVGMSDRFAGHLIACLKREGRADG